MKKRSLFVTFLFSCLCAYGQTFTNVTTSSGLPADRTVIWGFIDYNGDGFEDLLASNVSNNIYVLKLFKNNGNSTFSNVTANVGLPEIDSIRYGRVADFNKDGKQDFLLVDFNNKLQVFCASNSGNFEDKTIASGLSLSGNASPGGFQIIDLNKDGFPDLSYHRSISGGAKEIVCNINGFSGSGNNTSAILPPFANNITPQFQFSDYDNDRDLDLIVQTIQTYPWPGAGYYYHSVKTFQNQNGSFTEVPNVIPISVSSSYLIETDYNQDGYFDFIGGTSDNVFNGTPIVPVLKNLGSGTFLNSSNNPNFRIGNWYYAAFSETDFDLDGDLDYYSAVDQSGLDGSRFWVNTVGSFSEESSSLGIRLSGGSGSSPLGNWFDMDNDGDLDCLGSCDHGIVYSPGSLLQVALAKNNQSSANKWIKVNLKGCQSGTDGFYAVVKAKVGTNSYYRLKSPFQGYLAQSQFIHFGLGTANTIDSLIVKWPSGRTTILTNVAVNQTLTVNEDNCNAVSANCPDLSGSLLQGLAGYWPFCGNANDESGNGNNGTVNGATLTADRFGNQSKAYALDGNNQFISINDLDLSVNYSIAAWVKPQAVLGAIVSKYDATPTSSYELLYNNDPQPGYGNGGIYAHVGQVNDPGNNIYPPAQVGILPLGEWSHCILTIEGGKGKLYKNGILIYTDSIVNTTTINNVNTLFGRSVHGGNSFTGTLDDIAIWNRALSPQEITQLYNQGICQQSITVTDTLLIHTGITSYNPVAYSNTLKVWPNPGNQDITLDAGNLSSMQGWKYKVANTLGQTVVNETAISQQQTMIDLSNWGGNGIYYLHLINPQGHAVEIKKIVLAP